LWKETESIIKEEHALKLWKFKLSVPERLLDHEEPLTLYL
jgi:hypothetical protein